MRAATGRRLALGLVSSVMLGCAYLNRAESPRSDQSVGGTTYPATVTVLNHGWNAVSVYVAAVGGGSHRLGIVPSAGVGTFTLPRLIVFPAALQFVAIPLGIEDPQSTEPIAVNAGEKLVVRLEAVAAFSTVTKRP